MNEEDANNTWEREDERQLSYGAIKVFYRYNS